MTTPSADEQQLFERIARALDTASDQEVRESGLAAFQTVLRVWSRQKAILKMVHESFGQLRLDMKYLIFDLEATRRERDELKQRLGE